MEDGHHPELWLGAAHSFAPAGPGWQTHWTAPSGGFPASAYISYANLVGNNPATTFFIGDYAQLDWAMYEEGKWIKNPVRQWTGTKTMVLTNNQGVWDVGEFTATKTGGVIWMLRSEVNSFWATMQPQRVIMAPTVATRLSEPLTTG